MLKFSLNEYVHYAKYNWNIIISLQNTPPSFNILKHNTYHSVKSMKALLLRKKLFFIFQKNIIFFQVKHLC